MIKGWSWLQALVDFATFKTIQTPNGTSPVATSPTDVLTLTSSDNSVTITGNAATDTVDLVVASSGSGDVTGPASSTDEGLARFDGTTGKLLQNNQYITANDLGTLFVRSQFDPTTSYTEIFSGSVDGIDNGTLYFEANGIQPQFIFNALVDSATGFAINGLQFVDSLATFTAGSGGYTFSGTTNSFKNISSTRTGMFIAGVRVATFQDSTGSQARFAIGTQNPTGGVIDIRGTDGSHPQIFFRSSTASNISGGMEYNGTFLNFTNGNGWTGKLLTKQVFAIDFGSTGVKQKVGTYSSTAFKVGGYVIGKMIYAAPSGGDLDECEMDQFDIEFNITTDNQVDYIATVRGNNSMSGIYFVAVDMGYEDAI